MSLGGLGPLNSVISRVPSCCDILWCQIPDRMSKGKQQNEAWARQTHAHKKQESPWTMCSELRNPIPLRGKAGGKHKLIPSNFKQIYEGQGHLREQGGPPCLEGRWKQKNSSCINHGSHLGWQICSHGIHSGKNFLSGPFHQKSLKIKTKFCV